LDNSLYPYGNFSLFDLEKGDKESKSPGSLDAFWTSTFPKRHLVTDIFWSQELISFPHCDYLYVALYFEDDLSFGKINKTASCLLLPLPCLGFLASLLNFSVWMLNK